MSNVRNTQIAKIKIAKKNLGMDEDTYRGMLEMVTGKRSAADLDFHQRNAVLHHLEKNLGWKPSRKKYGPKSRQSKKESVEFLGETIVLERPRKSMGDKIRALWIEMHKQGIVKNASESALMGYVKRMTKGQYEAPQFCDDAAAWRIIESLKKWQARELAKRDSEE